MGWDFWPSDNVEMSEDGYPLLSSAPWPENPRTNLTSKKKFPQRCGTHESHIWMEDVPLLQYSHWYGDYSILKCPFSLGIGTETWCEDIEICQKNMENWRNIRWNPMETNFVWGNHKAINLQYGRVYTTLMIGFTTLAIYLGSEWHTVPNK